MNINNCCTMNLNEEQDGIELKFNKSLNKEEQSSLNKAGFRWSKRKKIYYAKQSSERLKFAEKIANNEINLVDTKYKKLQKVTSENSLWKLTQWNELNNVQKNLTCKEIAGIVRKHIKQRFSMCTFSITFKDNSIYIYIKSSPFEKDSEILKAILKYCKNYIKSYEYCTEYDPYCDYGSTYNFYFSIDIDYNYCQTEQSSEIIEEIKDFQQQKLLQQKLEKEKKEAEYQEYLKKEQIRKQEYEKLEQIRKTNAEKINNEIKIITLNETEQYYITNIKFSEFEQENRISDAKKTISEGNYNIKTVKIAKEIIMPQDCFELYSNMLMVDFNWIDGGYDYTDDYRFNSYQDLLKMNDEERKTIEWFYKDCILIKTDDNKAQLIIASEGYNYAKYVGFLENDSEVKKEYHCKQTITKEQADFNRKAALNLTENLADDIETKELTQIETEEFKQKLKEKIKESNISLSRYIIGAVDAKYKNLKELLHQILSDEQSLLGQLKAANIKQGDKLTLYKNGIIIVNVSQTHFTYLSSDKDKKSIFVYCKIDKNKGDYKITLNEDDKILIYKDWINIEQCSTYYDLNDILKQALSIGKKPIINTFRPDWKGIN